MLQVKKPSLPYGDTTWAWSKRQFRVAAVVASRLSNSKKAKILV